MISHVSHDCQCATPRFYRLWSKAEPAVVFGGFVHVQKQPPPMLASNRYCSNRSFTKYWITSFEHMCKQRQSHPVTHVGAVVLLKPGITCLLVITAPVSARRLQMIDQQMWHTHYWTSKLMVITIAVAIWRLPINNDHDSKGELRRGIAKIPRKIQMVQQHSPIWFQSGKLQGRRTLISFDSLGTWGKCEFKTMQSASH